MSVDILSRAGRLSTSAISDALDSFGVDGGLQGCVPRSHTRRFVGFAFTVKYLPFEVKPKEFQNAGNYIDDVKPGEVVVIDNAGRTDCTSWGGILTEVARIRELGGTIVNGAIRDLDEIEQCDYPVFSRAVFMQSGKNRVQKVAQQIPVTFGAVQVSPGDLVCADASGVVVIPSRLTDEVLSRAEAIAATEAKIIEAVRGGMELAHARKAFGYQEPWKS